MIPNGVDGLDHINIYSKGQTSLGRWLSNFAFSPIFIPDHGNFYSIEGYWYWLSCEKDELRQLHGYLAKKIGRELVEKVPDSSIHRRYNFEELIVKAIDIKLLSNKSMLMSLAESTLPLAHYYDYKGKKVDAGYEWIKDHIDSRRQIFKRVLNISPQTLN